MSPREARPDILVVDDEPQIRKLLRLTLEPAYSVREACTGRQGIAEAEKGGLDAVILDLGLPDIGGLEALRAMRERSSLPVLIVSVIGREPDKIEALDAGADDYLTKPFSGAELLARLRAMLRRARPAEEPATVRFGPVELDLAKRLVVRDGKAIKLTVREYALLQMMASHRGRVLTHRQLLSQLWGTGAAEQTHYLRVYMMRLRQKLEVNPDAPRYLQTESGVGYRFVE
jgi:two-component system KDP operon response regulator KdpE